MLTKYGVTKAILELAAALPHVNVADETADLWKKLLNDLTDDELRGGVSFYALDREQKFWPAPGVVLEYALRWRRDKEQKEFDSSECEPCGGSGLVPGRYGKFSPYEGQPCMRLCDCAAGRSKRKYFSGQKDGDDEKIPF